MALEKSSPKYKGCIKPVKRNVFLIVLMNLMIFSVLVVKTIVSIILFFPSFAVAKIITSWNSGRIMRLFVWIYGKAWLGIITPFTNFKREGFQNKRIKPPCIFVVNHLSFFDVFFMGAIPFSDVTFAIRSWPFKMFWYKPFMHLGQYLDVEKFGWKKTLAKSKNVLGKEGAILFFPEAHRSRDGRLGRFFSGAFKVAVETNIPIVPLCIVGTDSLFPPGQFIFRPSPVRLRALEPVAPNGFSGELAHLEMRRYVKQVMTENIYQMRNDSKTRRAAGLE